MLDKSHNTNLLVNVIEYLFIIVTVLQCNSIYLYLSGSIISKTSINLLWQLLLILLIICSLNTYRKVNAIKNLNLVTFLMIFLIIMGFLMIYNFIIYPSFPKNYIIRLLVDPILIIAFFYFNNNIKEIDKLFIYFENVVLWASYISLPLLLLYILKIPTTSTKISSWGGTQIENGYFNLSYFAESSKIIFLGFNWIRNSAMFTEPSIFGYVITIALLIEFFIRKNTILFNHRICFLLITVITTSSTTAIAVSFLAYIYYICISTTVYNKKYFNLILILFIPVFIIILYFVILDKLKSGMNDSSIRFDDIVAGLKAWKCHIFLGSGLGSKNLIISKMSSWRFLNYTKPSESSGLSTILAQGGIIWGLFYILPSFLELRGSYKKFGFALFSFIPFIFVVSQEFYIYIMIIMYFWYQIICDNKASD